MSKTIYIDLGNLYSEIETSVKDTVVEEIKDCCSYKYSSYDMGAGGKKEFQMSLFNEFNKNFPTGLYQRVMNRLGELGYKVKLRDNRLKPKINVDTVISKIHEFGLALRDYQIDGALEGIDHPNGLFNWGTGAGKTTLFIFLLLAYDTKTLILVNRKELMEQIAREISEITGRSVGMIGDGVWSPSKWTVGIVNTLNKGINSDSQGIKSRTVNYLKSVKYFMGDEIHHLGAKTWKDIVRTCESAYARHGFSGTCFHPDSEDLYLVAFTGEIISEVTSDYLIGNGWLARPHIYMPRILPDPDLHASHNWHETRRVFIRENDRVNESGVKFINKMYNKGISCIYFAGNDVPYGNRIKEMLYDIGISQRDIKFMTGKENSDTRRKVLNDFKERRIHILGGTTIYDEGVDVPHTGAGVNFGQGFSEISTVQRIGRVLRKIRAPNSIDVDPEDKQIKYFWDPMNLGNSITEKHSNFRKSLYEERKEFRVHEREYGSKPKS